MGATFVVLCRVSQTALQREIIGERAKTNHEKIVKNFSKG